MNKHVHAVVAAIGLVAAVSTGAFGQTTQTPESAANDSMRTAPVTTAAPKQKSPVADRIYYGGSVSLSFGNVFRIGFFPMIGYKLTPKASLGFEVGYEYLKYDNPSTSTSNYGGSVFAHYRIIPQAYAKAKFSLLSYETFSFSGASSRSAVPFLLLGGGAVQRLSPRTSAYVEVLFDVLQDSKSPYDNWEPFITAGVGVGF